MNDSIKDYINKITPALIAHLSELIGIPSVRDGAGENAPFGKDVAKALDYVLDLGEKFGFETCNMDGFIGEITAHSKSGKSARSDVADNNNTMIGILCHVDVVAGGDGWETEPFVPVVNDGDLFGRGSIDDKGPMLAALFAMKYLRECDLIPEGKQIKMLVGTNEEEDWKCIDHYLKHTDIFPDYSIVPDANFPVINCEKGLYNFDLICRQDDRGVTGGPIKIISLVGGAARNVVPNKCECILKSDSDPKIEKITALAAGIEGLAVERIDSGNVKLVAIGKSAHCMSPEKGINAVSLMFDFLGSIEYEIDCEKMIEEFNRFIGSDYYGEKLGMAMEDTESGKLTINVGVIEFEGGVARIKLDVRYPASMSFEEVEKKFRDAVSETGFEYEFIDHIESIYHSDDSKLISTLMKSYQKITGDHESKPLAIGGATYARALPNAVAYGPLFPWEEELAHEANEFINIDNLCKSIEIYADAIVGLMDIKD